MPQPSLPRHRNQSGAADVVDVQALIDSRPFTGYQWIILALCFLIVAIDGFDTAAIGYIAPALVQDWGIQKSALGPVMSAALFGLAFGAIFAGPMADRVGRKRVLVLSVFFFGASSLATAFAPTLGWLTVLRFLTGLGLGAAMPNAVTLTSEFAPQRRRAVLVNTMFCGFPLGSAAGGFVAAAMIPAFGWHSVLVLGGVLPIVLAALLVFLLPESVRYMVARQYPTDQIAAVLRRVTGAATQAARYVTGEAAPATKSAIGTVLSPGYRLGSFMLWATYFMGLVIFYLLTSWMPTLMKDAGFSIERASLLTALFPLGGGIGTIAAGWFMDRFNPNKVIALTYGITGVLIYTVGQGTGGSQVALGALIFLAGTAMNGAQSSMPSLAAAFYPTQGRATGVAWMLGIGRFGGITGALLGAELLRMQLGFDAIFTLLAAPAFLAAGALVVKYLGTRKLPGHDGGGKDAVGAH